MDVSFIIVNYNTTALTHQCIRSIQEWTKQQAYEIIVVDNASPDQSIAGLSEVFPEVKLILNTENAGFGRANNLGIQQSKGKYVFLINSDTYLLNDVVAVFYAYMEQSEHQRVACCGGELFYPDGTKQMCFGNFPSLSEAFSLYGFSTLYKTYFTRHISSGVVNYSDEIKEVDYITGADLFIRKAVLDEVGLFDPEFFMYFEETELAFRIKKAGYRSVLIPAAKIIHIDGGSQESGSYFNFNKIKIYEKSRNIFFRKSYGKVYAILIKMCYVLRNIILFVVKRQVEYLNKAKIVFNS